MNNDSTNDPRVWGPLMWNLLNEFVKHSDVFCDDCYLADYQNIIDELPYILPCVICQGHCKESYRTKIRPYINTINDFGRWIWTMKYIVNVTINERNISYGKYMSIIRRTRIFIDEEHLWKLLKIVCNNYSKNNDIYEYEPLLIFLESVGSLCAKIGHLSRFKILTRIRDLCTDKYFNINNVIEKYYKN